MRRRYYLAYGSNLNIRQMKIRCSTAEPMGVVILENYELLFRGGHGSAVATVEPKEGSSVPCAIWRITAQDEAALDAYEGFPHLYRKKMLPVQFNERRMRVMAYIMNDGHPIAMPAMGYYRTILNGYYDFSLDTTTLDAALISARKASAPFVIWRL